MTFISMLIQHHAGPTGKVLICKKENGKWAFPHGKLRTNETGPQAVERIAWEQLRMVVKCGKMTMIGRNKPNDGYGEHILCGNIRHNTDTKYNYREYYEAVDLWQTEPEHLVYDEYAWVHPTELAEYEFEGDDANFLAKYDPWVNCEQIFDVRMF